MAGYEIRNKVKDKKSNKCGVIQIGIGIIVYFLLALIKYFEFLRNTPLLEIEGHVLTDWNYLSPLDIVGSLFVFSGFSRLSLQWDFSKPASYMFLVYMIHPFVWLVLHNSIMPMFYGSVNAGTVIVIASVIVFFLSLVFAIIYKKIVLTLDIKEKICRTVYALFDL